MRPEGGGADDVEVAPGGCDDPGDEEFFEITREIAGFAATIREAFAEGMARPGYIPVSQMGGDIKRFAGRLGNVA